MLQKPFTSEYLPASVFNTVPCSGSPLQVPVQYGGQSGPSDLQNGPPKPTSEFTIKGGEKVNIQIEGIGVYFVLLCCHVSSFFFLPSFDYPF